MNPSALPAIFRLTALWALCESGLGGWMHALHLPFTGFFVGACAIVIISLIAHYSNGNFMQILRATLLVILVKAAVSPHSPPPAYLAVAFQGLMGAVLFSTLPFRIACLLLGMLAMVESALQKVLVATIIFGRSLWQALDIFFAGVVKDLHLSPDIRFSLWIILIYAGLYAIWGLIVGWWMMKLPERIEKHVTTVKQAISFPEKTTKLPRKKKAFLPKIVITILVMIAVVLVFSLNPETTSRAGYVMLRTLSVLAFLIWVINPLFRWLIQRWLTGNRRERQIQSILSYLPTLRLYIRPAYELAAKERFFVSRFRSFLIILLVLTLHPADEKI